MDAREKIETVLGEIQSSRSEFRTIINTVPSFAWSSRPDCSVDFVNNRWEEYTGLSSEQSYGEGWQAAIQPEDLSGLLTAELVEGDEVQAVMECGHIKQIELLVLG